MKNNILSRSLSFLDTVARTAFAADDLPGTPYPQDKFYEEIASQWLPPHSTESSSVNMPSHDHPVTDFEFRD